MAATSRASPPLGRRRGLADDAGMVTVEAAIGMGVFVLVLMLALVGVSMVLAQIRCTDAAREVARLVARGEPNRASDAVGRIAPVDATFVVHGTGDAIVVEVADDPVGALLPGVRVAATAYAVREPDPVDPGPSGGVLRPAAPATSPTIPVTGKDRAQREVTNDERSSERRTAIG